MDKLPTILLIIPNLGRGGAQRVFHQQRALINNAHVISVVFNFDGAFSGEQADGTISLDVPAGRNVWEKLSNFRRRVVRLRAIKKKYRVDLAISHLEGADYVNLMSGQGERRILWIHGSKWHDRDIRGLLGKLRLRVLLPWLYQRADRIVCVSHGIQRELTQRLPSLARKMATVQNGVDIQSIDRLIGEPIDRKFEDLFRENFVVVTHCRLAAQKNLLGLLSIVDRMKHLTNLKWFILGDGEERDTLLAECHRLQISTHQSWTPQPWTQTAAVYFLGYSENPYPLLKRANLYVMPSLWEGFPLAVCEAIVCGTPVMAADCHTGPREILAPDLTHNHPVIEAYFGQLGILMPVFRPGEGSKIEQWVFAIQKVMEQPGLLERYRVDSVAARETFSLHSVGQQLNQLIDDIAR